MVRAVFCFLFLTISVQAWAIELDSLNHCPALNSDSFQKVILYSPELNCTQVEEGPAALIKRIQRFLPAGHTIPQIGLVFGAKDLNAYYDRYALHVPLLLMSRERLNGYAPVDLEWALNSGALVTAHEYGHAVISTWLAEARTEFYDHYSLARRLSHTQLLLRLVSARDTQEMEEIQRRFGKSSEGQQQIDALMARSTREVERLNDRAFEFQSRLQPLASVRSFQEGYSEVFADLVAVLFADNWRAMAYAVGAISSSDLAISSRDFTSPRNALGQWAPQYEPHAIFAPVRYFIWKRLNQDWKCRDLRKELLLEVVFRSILRQFDDWKASGYQEASSSERNRLWIAELNRALSRENLQRICPRY